MKITKRQLRRIIREAIQGTAVGPNKGKTFLELTMNAVEAGDHAKAAGHIMDSYMISDVTAEDEDSLLDALAALPPDVRDSDLDRVADRWFKSLRGESEDNDRDELMDALEDKYGLKVRTTEEFGSSPGGIWLSGEDGSLASDEYELFNYYADGGRYEFGVHKEFSDFIKPYGFFAEWYDPGTIMLWRA